jgi:hypothetical protein
MPLLRYFAQLPTARLILWCYLAWYLAIVGQFFKPAPMLWLSALGMSAIIGFALRLSIASGTGRPDRWALLRLYLMPFCVSSYTAHIVGRGFVLIFPPTLVPNLIGLAACAGVLLLPRLARWAVRRQSFGNE